jgi:serine protease Do
LDFRRRLRLVAAVSLAALMIAGCSEDSEPGPRQENVAKRPAQVASNIPEEEPVAKVAAQVGPSVVQVNVRAVRETPAGPQSQEGLGSGVIYRKDGYIITNEHVVRGADNVSIAFADGSTARGEVVGGDQRSDIAVVRADRQDLPAAKFEAEERIRVGDLAVAIGSPSGFQSTVTAGVVSGLNREIPPRITGGAAQLPSLTGLIQTDAAISPGNSGGALVNREGEVIGINDAYVPQTPSGAPAEGLGFAIPAETAISVADQIIETGEVSHPYLGVRPFDLTPEIARQYNLSVERGVLVQVQPGSPADDAGLRNRDIITAVDSTRIEDSGDLFSALRDYQPGDQAQLSAVRDGEELTFEVTLGELPE